MGEAAFAPGLEGVVAAETRLSEVDGRAGELTIAGFPVEELAPRACFEETVYLLWNGRLPDAEELAGFREALASRRALPGGVVRLLRSAAAAGVPAMDALRAAAGALGLEDPEGADAESIVARFPTIVAAYRRLAGGEEPVEPEPKLGHAANYLYMLWGERPGEGAVRLSLIHI